MDVPEVKGGIAWLLAPVVRVSALLFRVLNPGLDIHVRNAFEVHYRNVFSLMHTDPNLVLSVRLLVEAPVFLRKKQFLLARVLLNNFQFLITFSLSL
jgi:hypothetical protein